LDDPHIRQPHTTPLPHRACHQPLDIKARIPKLIVEGDLVLVKDGEPKFERRLIASDVEEKRLLSHKAARVANDMYAEDLPTRKTTKGPSPTRSDTLKATASISNTPQNKHTTPAIFQHWRVIPTLNLQHHNPHRSSQTVINLLHPNPDPPRSTGRSSPGARRTGSDVARVGRCRGTSGGIKPGD